MNKQRLKAVALTTALSAGALMGSFAHADQTLDSILATGQAKTTAAKQSQARIEKLAEQTSDLLGEFTVALTERCIPTNLRFACLQQ